MSTAVSALRFFFTRTLDRPDLTRKHQAILSVAYRAGLRASEVSHLKVRDIDSERMLLRVECGKGGRHRNAMLAQDLLVLLREWWKIGASRGSSIPTGVVLRTALSQAGQHPAHPSHRRRS